MDLTVTSLYPRLAPPLRSTVASLYGCYLRWWRYGAETDRLAAEAIERESWPAGRWRDWQQQCLAHLLHRAATEVPYYRRQWSERRRRGDRSSWERLENWPLLDKQELRRNPLAFVAGTSDVRRMFHGKTSGSTGTPVQLWCSRSTMHTWYALFEARCRRWYGLSRYDRWAIFGAQVIAPANGNRPPYWVWNQALNQLYLSAYHLSQASADDYLQALRRREITYLYGFPSSLSTLADYALRRRTRLTVRAVVTAGEPLYPYQRKLIAQAFECPVRESYGMNEMVAGAAECGHGTRHLWPEAGVAEVMEDGHPVSSGRTGELICTGLLNADMPLVRYRVGDRASLAPPAAHCNCGRTLPILAKLEGRLADVLRTREGRAVGIPDVIGPGVAVRETQFVQESLDLLRIRYVPAEEFQPWMRQALARGVEARMAGVKVVVEEVESIAREPGGKFRVVVCKLPQAEPEGIDAGGAHAGNQL